MQTHRTDTTMHKVPSKSTLRRGRLLLSALLATALTGSLFLSAQSGFGQAEQPKKKSDKKDKQPAGNVGLQGILPDEVPDALVLEAFDPLGEDWTKWSEAVFQDLIQLYEGDDTTIAEQRKIIASLRSHMKKADAAIQQKNTPTKIRETLISIRGAILRRIDIAEAALDTLAADPKAARKQRLNRAWAAVTSALNQLEIHVNDYRGGPAWLGYVHAEAIRQAANEKNADAGALSAAAKRIRERNKLKTAEQREFLGAAPFLRLEKALRALLHVHKTAPKTVDTAKLRAALKKLVTSLEQYEETSTKKAASDARAAYESLYELSADGGDAMSKAMRSHYFNYNFRVYVAEPFLNRLIGDRRTERGRIRDRALGASIYGNQVTTTSVGVDLKPNKKVAHFDITLNGVTRANTVGVTEQANVYTSGYHRFWARKAVKFDGERFDANSRARVWVSANNRTYGAKTRYSHVPLLGGVTNRIAVREANKRRPQSEALTRQKISGRVSREFNAEVEKNFAEANKEFRENILNTIEDADVKPNAQTVRTTDDLLVINSRVMKGGELAGSAPNPGEGPGWGVTLRIHESAMNNAFDRLNIAGRTMTEDEVMNEIEKSLSNLTGDDKKTTEKKKSKSPDQFVFDKNDPIRFQVRGGVLNLVLRTGLKRPGEDDIPTQIITVPLNISVVDNQILIDRGTVGVAPAQPIDNRAEQIARAGIMRNKIEDAIPDEKHSNVFTFGEEEGKQPITITVTRISTVNGWVNVWAK